MSQTDLVKDMVCGMIKPKSQMPFTVSHQGKKYYFCSGQDKQIFEAYPDRWVNTVKEE